MTVSLAVNFLLLAVGAYFLYQGANLLISSASKLAQNFGIPLIAVSFTVIALGTSTPKLIVGIVAGLSGHGDLVVSNIIGGNLANLGLVLGLGALLSPLGLPKRGSKIEIYSFILSVALLYLLALDGTLSRLDGAVLCLVGAAFMAAVIRTHREAKHLQEALERAVLIKRRRESFLNLLAVAAAVTVIFVGATFLVENAGALAQAFRVSVTLIGLTVVAIGTSLPEISTTIISSMRQKHDLTIGNIIGSNILNVLVILGVTVIITPVRVAPVIVNRDLPLLLMASVVIASVMRGGRLLTRRAGAILILAYLAYVALILSLTPVG